MEQTRIGLIGVGRFCPNYHIPNLSQRRDVEITAVCDISQDRLDNLPEVYAQPDQSGLPRPA